MPHYWKSHVTARIWMILITHICPKGPGNATFTHCRPTHGPWHHAEETQNTDSHNTKLSNQLYLFLNKMMLLTRKGHPVHVRIQRGDRGSGPPLKDHKNIVFSSIIGLDPLKNRSYQASIQCWAIIGMPAKRHLMAFRWRADDGPLIVVLGSSLPSSA